MVLFVFLGAVFLDLLLSSIRLPFSSPVFFSLFLNFKLLGLVGLGSCLFHSFVCSPFPPLVMSASVGLRIEGRPTEESVSGRNGDGPGGPVVAVARVFPVGYLPPPGKGEGNISEIWYHGGSKYLRVAVRYVEAVGPSRIDPSFVNIFATRYGPLPVSESGVLISSRLMWCPFPRWSASLRRPLGMTFHFLYTPS